RYLGDRAFGQMSLALTLFYTFQVFAIAGLKTLVTREVAKDRTKTDKFLVNGSVAVIGTSLASLAFAAILVRLLNYPADTAQVILLVSLSMFPVALIAIVEAILQAWERMHVIALVNVPVNLLKIGAAFVLLAGGADVNSVIGVLFVAFTVILLAEWALLLWRITRPRIRLDLGFMIRMLRQTTTFFGIDGIIAIVASLNLVLLSKLASEREVGLIGAATQFLTPLQVVYQNVVTSLFPMMSRQLEPGFRSLKRITEGLVEILVMFGLPATLGIFVLAGQALVFLYGQESFADATLVLRIYSITVILRAVIHALGQVLIAGMRERDTLRIVMVGVVLNVILGVALISRFGMLGAALASLLVTFVDLILHYYYIRRLFSGPVRIARALWRPAIATAAMSVYLVWALPWANERFLVVVGMGALIYAVTLAVVLVLTVGGPGAIKARYLRSMSEAPA
ncbi:MAG: flippase, partial [Anaerolineae bacterium]|nr:flippase [Anaerolineae bacterium]